MIATSPGRPPPALDQCCPHSPDVRDCFGEGPVAPATGRVILRPRPRRTARRGRRGRRRGCCTEPGASPAGAPSRRRARPAAERPWLTLSAKRSRWCPGTRGTRRPAAGRRRRAACRCAAPSRGGAVRPGQPALRRSRIQSGIRTGSGSAAKRSSRSTPRRGCGPVGGHAGSCRSGRKGRTIFARVGGVAAPFRPRSEWSLTAIGRLGVEPVRVGRPPKAYRACRARAALVPDQRAVDVRGSVRTCSIQSPEPSSRGARRRGGAGCHTSGVVHQATTRRPARSSRWGTRMPRRSWWSSPGSGCRAGSLVAR